MAPPAGRIDHELIWGLLAALGLVTAALLPADLERLRLSVCVFHRVTGQPCVLCGGTRAWQAFAHGHWLQAWTWNPMAAVLALGALLTVGYCGWAITTGRRWRPPHARLVRWLRWAALLALPVALANWVYLIRVGR